MSRMPIPDPPPSYIPSDLSTPAPPLGTSADPTPVRPDQLSGGAVPWPTFVVRRIPGAGPEERDSVWFKCAACGRCDLIDDATGLCVECWRPVALLSQALADLRAELLREIRGEKP